jgi:TonB family protein
MTGLDNRQSESKDVVQADGSLRPKITHFEKAEYPIEAKHREEIQGVVLVSAIFRADGRITDIKIVCGLSKELDAEAIKAASKIKFTPALKNGVPVSTRMVMEFTFSLR